MKSLNNSDNYIFLCSPFTLNSQAFNILIVYLVVSHTFNPRESIFFTSSMPTFVWYYVVELSLSSIFLLKSNDRDSICIYWTRRRTQYRSRRHWSFSSRRSDKGGLPLRLSQRWKIHPLVVNTNRAIKIQSVWGAEATAACDARIHEVR